MRSVLVLMVAVLLLTACATTTAQERADNYAIGAVLDVMFGIGSLATGDPLGAGMFFGNAGLGLGLSAAEGPGSGAPPPEDTSGSVNRPTDR